ncbi:MAG: hypothetical protein FWD35_03590 [Oscillospiraceae bacterium]|nr:hypothetical protein [Oscillospiraceae bacterium]
MIESKMMLRSISAAIAKSKTLKEAHAHVRNMANVEGVAIPTYEEELAEIRELRGELDD